MATVEFFDRTMMETMALLAESRRYLIDRAETENKTRPVDQGLISSMETMRLVARLTQVLAWLLTHRAVHAGELTLWEATRPDRRLGGHTLCSRSNGEDDPKLPEELRRLLQRSLSLYQRISRLDQQTARAAAEGARQQASGGPKKLS
jgi:regulator of CtrA degradation